MNTNAVPASGCKSIKSIGKPPKAITFKNVLGLLKFFLFISRYLAKDNINPIFTNYAG